MNQIEQMANKPDRFTVKQLIEEQIDQTYDRFRMRQAWERVLTNCEPAEFAEGLCMALSGGHFTRGSPKALALAPQITISVAGDADPVAVASAFKSAFDAAVTSHR